MMGKGQQDVTSSCFDSWRNGGGVLRDVFNLVLLNLHVMIEPALRPNSAHGTEYLALLKKYNDK